MTNYNFPKLNDLVKTRNGRVICFLISAFLMVLSLRTTLKAINKTSSGPTANEANQYLHYFEKIDLNKAKFKSICRLNGIGRSKAAAIIQYRKKHKLTKLSQLIKIRGISRKIAISIAEEVTLINDLSNVSGPVNGNKKKTH